MVDSAPPSPAGGEGTVALRAPWGAAASLGLTFVCLVAYVILQLLVATVVLVVETTRQPHSDLGSLAAELGGSGLLIGASTLASAIPCTAMVLLFAARRQGGAVAYLRLDRPRCASVLRWLAALAVLLVASDLLSLAAGEAVVPEFMLQACRTAGFLPVLLTALVVAAPVFEELLFRGFLFRGLEASRIGGVGAVVVTAAVWAAIHLQYDLFHLGLVFLMGLFLGMVRCRTGSTSLTVLLHAATNLVATGQALLASGAFRSSGVS